MNNTAVYQSEVLGVLGRIDLSKVDHDSGRRIFVFGNGGSASTASHFACDMVKGASYFPAQK